MTSRGKRRILTSCGAETPEPIPIKLEIYDYVRDSAPHKKFGAGSFIWVVWANKRFVTSLGFFSFVFVFFITPTGHISSPILTMYTPKCVFPCKGVPFWKYRANMETPPLALKFLKFCITKAVFRSKHALILPQGLPNFVFE